MRYRDPEDAEEHVFSNEIKLKEFLEKLITAIEKRMKLTLDDKTRENLAANFANQLIEFDPAADPDARDKRITGKFLLNPDFNFIPSLVLAITANHLADEGKIPPVTTNDINTDIVNEFKQSATKQSATKQSATSPTPKPTLSLIDKSPKLKEEIDKSPELKDDIANIFNGIDNVRDNVFNKDGSLNMAVFNNLISIASMFEELGMYSELRPSTPKPS